MQVLAPWLACGSCDSQCWPKSLACGSCDAQCWPRVWLVDHATRSAGHSALLVGHVMRGSGHVIDLWVTWCAVLATWLVCGSRDARCSPHIILPLTPYVSWRRSCLPVSLRCSSEVVSLPPPSGAVVHPVSPPSETFSCNSLMECVIPVWSVSVGNKTFWPSQAGCGMVFVVTLRVHNVSISRSVILP